MCTNTALVDISIGKLTPLEFGAILSKPRLNIVPSDWVRQGIMYIVSKLGFHKFIHYHPTP